jgi:hypothetical protein
MAKMKRTKTNLWYLVDRWQQNLDSLGLDEKSVDQVITRRVALILESLNDPPGRVPWSSTRLVARA